MAKLFQPLTFHLTKLWLGCLISFQLKRSHLEDLFKVKSKPVCDYYDSEIYCCGISGWVPCFSDIAYPLLQKWWGLVGPFFRKNEATLFLLKDKNLINACLTEYDAPKYYVTHGEKACLCYGSIASINYSCDGYLRQQDYLTTPV